MNIRKMVEEINEGLRGYTYPLQYSYSYEKNRYIFDPALEKLALTDLRYNEAYKRLSPEKKKKVRKAYELARKIYARARAGQDFYGRYFVVDEE